MKTTFLFRWVFVLCLIGLVSSLRTQYNIQKTVNSQELSVLKADGNAL